MNLYFVRHGQTTANASKTHQNAATPLSELGEKEAAQLGKRFIGVKLDKTMVSPMLRAQQTAQAITNAIGSNFEIWEDLQEVKAPSSLVGLGWQSPESQAYMQARSAHAQDSSWHYEDEENWADLKARVLRVKKELIKLENQDVLCVSHSTFIKAFAAMVLFEDQLTLDNFLPFRQNMNLSNTGICQFHYSQADDWEIIRFNDTHHLLDE